MRRAAVALATLALLAACGSDASDGSDGSGTSEDPQDPATGTVLTIEVTPDADLDPRTYELTCDPAGGDHPQPEQACDALSAAGADVFEPVPGDQACTEIYGGPQVATVTGTYAGADVEATFNRTNGCEIDRWDTLGTTFFDIPLQ